MYLMINENRHKVVRRYFPKGRDEVRYLGVEPEVEEAGGVISMYRDDGFLLSQDDVSNYARQSFNGGTLMLTNEPEEEPVEPEPSETEQMAAAIREGVNSVE